MYASPTTPRCSSESSLSGRAYVSLRFGSSAGIGASADVRSCIGVASSHVVSGRNHPLLRLESPNGRAHQHQRRRIPMHSHCRPTNGGSAATPPPTANECSQRPRQRSGVTANGCRWRRSPTRPALESAPSTATSRPGRRCWRPCRERAYHLVLDHARTAANADGPALDAIARFLDPDDRRARRSHPAAARRARHRSTPRRSRCEPRSGNCWSRCSRAGGVTPASGPTPPRPTSSSRARCSPSRSHVPLTAPSTARTYGPGLGPCLGLGLASNRSRSTVFLNLPVAVRGISSMNSKRSGSCHLAYSPARCSRSASAPRCRRHAARPPPAAARPSDRRGSRSPLPRRPPGEPSAGSRGRPTRSTRPRT